jgi:MEDS: MEthanogen/methylotroph, DcmR Sensory domain
MRLKGRRRLIAIAIAPTTPLARGEVKAAFFCDMPLGTHFCIFQDTTEDLFDTFVPYFRAGLENEEFCLWLVPDPLKKEEALRLLRQAVPNFDHYLAQESIEVIPHDEWFFPQGTFDLPTAVRRLGDKLRLALSRGYAGLRMNKSGSRLYKECPGQFSAFEKGVERADREREIDRAVYLFPS